MVPEVLADQAQDLGISGRQAQPVADTRTRGRGHGERVGQGAQFMLPPLACSHGPAPSNVLPRHHL